MNWKLEYNGKIKSFADWGLSQLTLRSLNQGKDIVTFSLIGNNLYDEDLFSPESSIRIVKGKETWFAGRVIKTPGMGDPFKEEKRYEVAGPWWYLENLIYQQEWRSGPSKTILSSRVILGRKGDGNRCNANDQIREILQYAIQSGAPFDLGDLDVAAEFPYDEAKDISCAEAVQRILRWVPDAVVWFDYSKKTRPLLYIKRRSAMTTFDLSLNDASGVQNLRITPRHDLVLPGVIIKYERHHKSNDQQWITIQEDKFPENMSDKAFKALVMTVELDGGGATHVKQKVSVQPLDVNDESWWIGHMPFLRSAKPGSIVIESSARTGTLPNELISGGISKWMPVSVEEEVIRAKISYETEHETVNGREVAVRVYATNATSRSYYNRVSSASGEEVPVGLSKVLYESVSKLHYDGEVQLEQNEVGGASLMGSVINIKGGKKEWETMSAVIQEVRMEVDYGRTYLRFGTPKHLGADDLIELTRNNRRRTAARSAIRRMRPSKRNQGLLEQSTHSRIENTDTTGSAYERLEFKSKGNPERKIIVDAGGILKDLVVQLREEGVCENGQLKRRLVLCSEPYQEQDSKTKETI